MQLRGGRRGEAGIGRSTLERAVAVDERVGGRIEVRLAGERRDPRGLRD